MSSDVVRLDWDAEEEALTAPDLRTRAARGLGAASSVTTARTPARVLLAEDDEAMRAFLADALREDGYEILEASNGRELFWMVETARRGRPIDLVVSDLRMPVYNGLDVVEAWVELGRGPGVVLMSAFPEQEIRRRVERLGVVLLDKPFDVGRLRELVRELLGTARGTCDESRSAGELNP